MSTNDYQLSTTRDDRLRFLRDFVNNNHTLAEFVAAYDALEEKAADPKRKFTTEDDMFFQILRATGIYVFGAKAWNEAPKMPIPAPNARKHPLLLLRSDLRRGPRRKSSSRSPRPSKSRPTSQRYTPMRVIAIACYLMLYFAGPALGQQGFLEPFKATPAAPQELTEKDMFYLNKLPHDWVVVGGDHPSVGPACLAMMFFKSAPKANVTFRFNLQTRQLEIGMSGAMEVYPQFVGRDDFTANVRFVKPDGGTIDGVTGYQVLDKHSFRTLPLADPGKWMDAIAMSNSVHFLMSPTIKPSTTLYGSRAGMNALMECIDEWNRRQK